MHACLPAYGGIHVAASCLLATSLIVKLSAAKRMRHHYATGYLAGRYSCIVVVMLCGKLCERQSFRLRVSIPAANIATPMPGTQGNSSACDVQLQQRQQHLQHEQQQDMLRGPKKNALDELMGKRAVKRGPVKSSDTRAIVFSTYRDSVQ